MSIDEQQALNAPYLLPWRDKVLRFAGVTQAVKAECVAACKMTALREHNENLKLFFPNKEDAAIRGEWQDRFECRISTGRYGWSGDLLAEWRSGTSEGMVCFIGALLRAGGTPLTTEEIEEMSREHEAELAIILKLVAWDAACPKAPRPPEIMELAAALKSLTSTPQSSATSEPQTKSAA